VGSEEEVAISSNLQVKLNISTTLSGDMLAPCEEQKMWIPFKISWIHTQMKKGMATSLMMAKKKLPTCETFNTDSSAE